MQIKKEAAQITAEQTRLLFNGLRSSVPVSLLLASTLAYIQWPVIEHAVIIGWLGALLVINLLRALLAMAYTRVMPLADQAFLWKLGFAVGVGAAGAIWGLGAWLLYPPESIPNQAFLGVLMAGLTAGAVATLVASRTMTLTFLLLTLAPLALRFLSSDHPTIFTLGILTLLFLGVSTASSRNLNASILQNIRLRLEGNTREAQLRASEAQALKLSRVADRTDNGVIIVGHTNLPALAPVHSSQMFSANMMAFLKELIVDGELKLDLEDEVQDGAAITHGGKIVDERLKGGE